MTDLIPEAAASEPAGAVKIRIEGLKKSFGDLLVLNGIDTTISQGEVVCVIGPSGSGKSTFLRCLNKLEDISGGRVTIDEFDLTDKNVDLDKVRQHIGMVFQHFNLFPHMTVIDNVTLAPLLTKKMDKAAAEKKALELLAQVGLAEKAASITRDILTRYHASSQVEVVICPPFTALQKVGELLRAGSVLLGAQNVHWETTGAFTGEISAPMLKELGCRYAIVGHSERRQLFGETDGTVRKRLRAALDAGLSSILCVGETLQQRQQGRTWEVIEVQLQTALERVETVAASAQMVVAYEPVWAIGTGQNATAAQAQEVHGKIRRWLAGRFGQAAAEKIRIQYGGSVKADNAAELMREPDVDGALVGGASLDPKAFISIVESTLQAKEAGCSTASS